MFSHKLKRHMRDCKQRQASSLALSQSKPKLQTKLPSGLALTAILLIILTQRALFKSEIDQADFITPVRSRVIAEQQQQFFISPKLHGHETIKDGESISILDGDFPLELIIPLLVSDPAGNAYKIVAIQDTSLRDEILENYFVVWLTTDPKEALMFLNNEPKGESG
jgi:hypothetical protein